jgi:O-acetyl-ADP-ribose deacetylase (regulator of RNase III)
MEIKYVKGDATAPIGNGSKIIVHICNDIGGWGKGFVTAISRRWSEPESSYRDWYKTKDDFELGKVQFVKVDLNLWIANLIGQHKINKDEQDRPPIRYEALESGLQLVRSFATEQGATVHMPRIGCGLAGGRWEEVEPIIKKTLTDQDIEVTVYDFE